MGSTCAISAQRRQGNEGTKLLMDDDVTKKSGIVPYVLGEGERCLSIRAFTEAQKLAAYTR